MSRAGIAVRREARWLVLHWGARTLSKRYARKGMPLERMLFEPGARQDPHPLYEEIRARGRIVKSGAIANATVDYAIISAALRDSASFSVNFGESAETPRAIRWLFRPPDPDIASVVEAPALLGVDPPTHTRYRRRVSKPFTPRALQQVTDRVEERAVQLLDGLAGRDRVDIVREYGNLLPVAVIAEILGVPAAMRDRFLAWGHAAAPVLDVGLSHREYRSVNQALKAMNEWFAEHFENLRRNPGDDILSQLVNADPADRLNDLELRATAMLLLGAGFETTVNLLGSGVNVIANDDKARTRLAADPALWEQAVDELLRLESPVQMTGRLCIADTEIDGVQIPKGMPLLCLLGGANRDPAVFDNPASFDLDRPNSRDHVALSAGIHYCLGANLARMEGQLGLRLLFERFPDLAVVPGSGRRRDLQALRGFESLQVELNAS
ncbi:MAG TPA: cytochrome P450 [Mycobacteriales bacterium]|nr:cytochrome P450 [Mycobacteriales bacterium]